MDIEQLKLILGAVQALGAEGKSAFLWWIVADKVVPTLGWLLTFCGICWISLKLILTTKAHYYICSLRDSLNIGCPGMLTQSEFDRVVEKIKDLMESNP